jgi:hypothetical protein
MIHNHPTTGRVPRQNSRNPPETGIMDERPLTELDDTEFLTVCRTVHRVAERTPEDELSAETRAKLDQVNAEFLRRAGISWQRVS